MVVDDADVYAELKSFFNEYSIPLLWNNQFHYAGASEFDCSKKNLYADQELVCIGKLPSDNRCASVSDLDFSFGDSLLADDNMLNVSLTIQEATDVWDIDFRTYQMFANDFIFGTFVPYLFMQDVPKLNVPSINI